MNRIKAIMFLFVFGLQAIYAQDKNEVRAVNNYVTFVNESIHGLLIAHRLFEIYNQTVNKYVDLPDYQLNNYSNADLPEDIFRDPEGWFYEESNPYLLYEAALREGAYLGSNVETINQHVSELKRLLGVLNMKRISIAKILDTSDLTQSINLQKVYTELESVVDLYDRFFEVYQAIDIHLQSVYQVKRGKNTFTQKFFEFYSLSKLQVGKLRDEAPIEKSFVAEIGKKVVELEKISLSGDPQSRKRILTNVSRLVKAIKDYNSNKAIPIEYELYGSHYHYHNVTMLNLINRYGNGFIHEFNDLAQENGWIKEVEVPHFYKVLYPRKLPKEELTTLNDDKLIALLNKQEAPINSSPKSVVVPQSTTPEEDPPQPKQKEEITPINYTRGIVVHQEVIFVNADSFDLELYDHLIKDGDRVSIKVNDEWKFKNISLEKEPKTVTIHIKPGQQNYILVHADNTGYRPPNTIALAYTVNGERKEISLQTDLENSQMVEIKYQ